MILFFGTGFLLEIFLLSRLFSYNSFFWLYIYFFVHFVISMILGLVLYFIYKKEISKHAISYYTLLFFSSGPVGIILMGTFCYLYLGRDKKIQVDLYSTVDEDKYILDSQEQRTFGEGVLSSKFVKPEVMVFLSNYYHPISFFYFRKLLSSEDDEIRLMAFSNIARHENRIMEQIRMLEEKISGNYEDKFLVYYQLAESFWELVFLNLSDKELQKIYLNKAEESAKSALKLKDDPKVLYLLGRIYIKKGDYNKAEEVFIRCYERKFPTIKVLPYLMEVYYRNRNFDKIIEISKSVSMYSFPNQKSLSIIAYWNK